jgi:hypothetical protein
MNTFAGAVTSGSYLRGNGTNVVMSTIQAADVPTLNQNTTGTASNVTGTVAIVNGGTGQTTRQAAIDALAGAVTSGTYLRGDGTDVVMSAIQAADVPTLNQNTTGNAATATNLTSTNANWSTNGVITAVVGQLAWKNYGNSHTIFDASASTAPNGSAVNNANPTNAWTGTYPTLMGWNGSTTYGVRVDSARVADSASSINAAGATYLVGNVTGSYICTNFNRTPNQLGYGGTWTNYNQTLSPGQNTLFGWIRRS